MVCYLSVVIQHLKITILHSFCQWVNLFSNLGYANRENVVVFSGVVESSHVVRIAYAVWSLIPATWKTLESSSDSLKHKWVTIPVISLRCRIHFGDSWFVLIETIVHFTYVPYRSIVRTIARHSRFVLSFRRLAWSSTLEQFPMGFTVLSGCSCRRRTPTGKLQAHVSSTRRSLESGSATIDGVLRECFCNYIEWSFFSSSIWNVNSWTFWNFFFESAAILAKLGRKHLKSMHNQRNKKHLARFVGS